jgi:hypothetical protein
MKPMSPWATMLITLVAAAPVCPALAQDLSAELDRLEPRVAEELLKDGHSLERLSLRLDLQALGEGCLVELLDTKDGSSVAVRKLAKLPGDSAARLAELTVVVAELVRSTSGQRAVAPPPAAAVPAETAPKGVLVKIRSTDPDAELYEHLGTSVGQASNGVQVVAVHVERRCKTPCERRLELSADHDFFIDGAGVTTSDLFTLPTDKEAVTLQVDAGNGFLAGLGGWLFVTGLTGAITGGTLLAVDAAVSDPLLDTVGDTTSGLTTAGIGILVGGLGAVAIGLPLRLLNGTDVQISSE